MEQSNLREIHKKRVYEPRENKNKEMDERIQRDFEDYLRKNGMEQYEIEARRHQVFNFNSYDFFFYLIYLNFFYLEYKLL